jgi:hypothetical protein
MTEENKPLVIDKSSDNTSVEQELDIESQISYLLFELFGVRLEMHDGL